MSNRKPVTLMLTISEEVRDQLRIMAAQENLKNPSRVTSASTIAKEIVCEFLQDSVGTARGGANGTANQQI